MQDPGELLERIREGDIGSFEAIYDKFSRLVYAVAHRVLENEAAAEDVTQGVFLKLWVTPEAFRGGNFPGWLARIARNRAIDARRSAARERTLAPGFDGGAQFDDVVVAELDSAHALGLIKALPRDQRLAIELAYLDGLSHAEISHRTSIPLGTVKTRIRAGLRSLRGALASGVAK